MEDVRSHIKTVMAMAKVDEDGASRISGDFAVMPAIKLRSKTSITSCMVGKLASLDRFLEFRV